MTDIRFYHLTRTPLEHALPDLLTKTLDKGWRAVVRTSSPERCEALTQALWTARPDSFLPHGNRQDGEAARQPIWLTDQDDNPNGATVLFLTDGASLADATGYNLICDLFDGRDPEAVQAARARWKERQTAGHSLTYWRQEERGWQEVKSEQGKDTA
ncbi:MAG: DNA polymerase III subunit chi [Alphaproteobacteria bacterium]|nr:MAG: DNA polymerase III subunit chi [Alphaproteobacteria bacterium]